MSTITITRHCPPSSMKKRRNTEETTTLSTKKIKRSLDVTSHWKKLHSIFKANTTQVFECKSKSDYLIITDPLGNRSRFVMSKSSYYWLNESIRLMQQHVEYGTTFDAAVMGEIVEIERNLKALKTNVEKGGIEKTFFFRAETLLNFVRLCCTFSDSPVEKFRRRLHALFNLCASCWLHMLDIMLPTSIVRAERSFIFDDDYDDFENDSILRHYRTSDQKHIKKANNDLPNIGHLLDSILLLMEKLNEVQLIDRVYLERFEMIYQMWMLIDNELNLRKKTVLPTMCKQTAKKKLIERPTQRVSWNFIDDYTKYEKMFGASTSQMK